MLRGEEEQSCAVPLIWTEFSADVIEHRVREVTSGTHFSFTRFTPSHLDRPTERDWMNWCKSCVKNWSKILHCFPTLL